MTNERQQAQSPTATTSNAIKGLDCKHSINEFVHLASDCYDKCINVYLDNLNDCNRRADIIERQSVKSQPGYIGKLTLKSRKIKDLSLANRINKLNINLDTYHREKVSYSPEYFNGLGQSPLLIQHCFPQSMSCNDTNNNRTESTNQLRDPPKIVLSDHSTNQSLQGDNSKDYSDKNSVKDKNCLTIPIDNYYSSEARPP